MPSKDEIREIGKNKCIWEACIDCGRERWVQIRKKGKPKHLRCRSCAGKRRPKPIWNYFKEGSSNPMWKGGRRMDFQGYIRVRIYPDDPMYPMADSRGYVKEHRLVMARTIGRCLRKDELVHHKDRNKHNNNFNNLGLTDNKNHYPIKHLLDRIEELEKEVSALKDRMTLEKTRITKVF